MTLAKIVRSQYDGQAVLYVDALKLRHSGVVVGQSPNGEWYYIQSDNPKVPPQKWHFQIAAGLIGGVLLQ